MNSNQSGESTRVFTQCIRLSGDHKSLLDNLKTKYRISNNDAIRRGIELVAKQLTSELKNSGVSLEA